MTCHLLSTGVRAWQVTPRHTLEHDPVVKNDRIFVADNQGDFNPGLLIGDVGSADIDWNEFNLEEKDNDNICHPSAYGYRMIAEYTADLLKVNKLLGQ